MVQVLRNPAVEDRPVLPAVEAPASALLQKLEAFQDFSAEARNAISRLVATAKDYPAHTDILREGEPADGVLVVLRGFACRNQFRQNGARQITAYLLPGDHCRLETGLINRMDNTISTLSPCRVARVPSEALQAVVRQHPAVRQALRMCILINEATLREWIVNIGCRTALERIAHLFCELHLRLSGVGLVRGMTYDLPVTQTDIAVTVGLSNVHVNRSLQALRKQRLIALSGRRLTILDWERLRALAEFSPSYLQAERRILNG
ncbi:Crp/Fnr family transcriptional regulator [Methylobacterium sp. M6A4_1b]